MSTLSGGRIVARALKAEGITHLFTLCGGHIQSIYDGCLDEGIRVVDFRHEQSAVHAADGWARTTGRPGAAAVTAGPGVTDSVTAVANAWRAQVPLVLIGGQGARTLGPLGGQDRGALQEMNHVELLRPITKWAVSVPETRRLGEYVQSAFRTAMSCAPGPVFLEMPLDVLMNGVAEEDVISYGGYRTAAVPCGDPRCIEEAAAILSASSRPVLIVGSQLRWSPRPEGLTDFLKEAPMPAFLNGMARGALPKDHPCNFRQGRAGTISGSDCIVLFGTPFDFRLGYGENVPPGAKVIQVDLEGREIGRNRGVDAGIIGDSGTVLSQLASALRGGRLSWKDWLARAAAAEARAREAMAADMASEAEPINPLRLCRELNRFIDGKTIVVGDGGDFVATAASVLDVEGPWRWMDPGPLGTLGVGPGYAMAARLARPDHRVILVLGDGSFGFNGMEFESMARQGIKVVGIVGNDARWTQIYRYQVALYGKERAVATTLGHTRYDLMVEALGGHGEHVEKLGDLVPALERAFAAQKAALVNVEIGDSDFRKNALAV